MFDLGTQILNDLNTDCFQLRPREGIFYSQLHPKTLYPDIDPGLYETQHILAALEQVHQTMFRTLNHDLATRQVWYNASAR